MKRLLIVSALCASCCSTLFGQSPLTTLAGSIEDLLGNWESISPFESNDGSIYRFFDALTFEKSGDGILRLSWGSVDTNTVMHGQWARGGATVRVDELRQAGNATFEFRHGKAVVWTAGSAKIDIGRTKSPDFMENGTGQYLFLLLGNYLVRCGSNTESDGTRFCSQVYRLCSCLSKSAYICWIEMGWDAYRGYLSVVHQATGDT